MRTRNGGGSAFAKFPTQLSCCVFSGFTDMFDNFTPLVSVLCQIFLAIRGDTERFQRDLQYVIEVLFLAFLGVLAVNHRAVSLGGGDLSYRQHDWPNEAMIATRWYRCWEEKPELKLWCRGMCFCHVMPRIFLRQVVWKWFSFYAVKLSTFHSHKGGW